MKDNITDWALNEYMTFYGDDTITKENIFYYTYGILHHSGYRKKYQKSLVRGLPHVPMAPDFWSFYETGKNLAALHLDYETCKRYDLGEPLAQIPDNPTSIRFATGGDQTTLFVNNVKVYDNLPVPKYKVNGRTPVGWLTFVPKKSSSGINRQIFRVFTGEQIRAMIERLTFVGLESDRVIAELDKLEFESANWKPKKAGLDLHMDVSGEVQSTL